MAYCHVARDTSCIADDMARLALEAGATITFWEGHLPEDAPGN